MSPPSPTSLGAGGYEAVLCGRMHFVGYDQFHGFERRIVGDQGEKLSPEIKGSGYNRTTGQTRYAVQVSGYGSTGMQFYDRTVTDRACEFISAHREGDRPYCLVVGLILPHNPLTCSRELFDYYLDRIPVPSPMPESYLGSLHPAITKWRERRGVDDLTPEQNHRGLAAYYGLVTELDRNLGRIVDAVRSSAQADDTAIIYCSDHGDMACEHGMWWKSSFYDGSARVPCIVSWPERFDQGKVVDAVISLIDLGPTLPELAGAEHLPDASGRSFAGYLRDDGLADDWPSEVYSEYLGLWGDQPPSMVRRGRWKLNYYHEFKSYQLFDLENDPAEMRDRAKDRRCRAIATLCLERILERWDPEQMLASAQRQHRASGLIRSCGHDLLPRPVPPFVVPAGCNHFDFGQLKQAGSPSD